MSVTEMVLVPLAPTAIDSDGGEDESVKAGAALTVRETVVDAVSAPEVPVTLMVEVPTAAALEAVRVSRLEPVVGLVAKAAVTPEGRPVAARVTLPVNPLAGVTVMVSVALAPCVAETAEAVGAMVKLGDTLTVRLRVVEAVSAPEVPVMVMVAGPVAAELDAVRVTTLVAVAGLGAKEAVTPLGRPVADRVTAPVKPCAPVMVMVSAVLLPCVVVIEGAEAARVKLGAMLTVRAMVVEAVRAPEVPVMVTVAAPVAAVLEAVSVSTLEPVVGLVAKAAVTPLGRPLAARVTAPVNPETSVTVTVSVPLVPCVMVKVGAEGARVKLGGWVTVRETAVTVDRSPEVPVMVTVLSPTVAEEVAVKVTRLEPVAGLVAKEAVTPLGSPEAAKVTSPVKPLAGVTVTVSEALLPCVTEQRSQWERAQMWAHRTTGPARFRPV